MITGTIFENTKIHLRVWFAALFMITSSKKGISSIQLSTQLGITQKTGWFLLHRIREMLRASESHKPLENIVEIDETYAGGIFDNMSKIKKQKIREANGGKGAQGRSGMNKVTIVGLVQREGRVVTFVVDNTNAETLHQIIDNNVSDTATIVTDAYTAYAGLNKKYNHIVVKHRDGEYVNKQGNTKFHTQNIEGFWSIFKRGYIGIYHFMSRQHMHRYTTEFGYRYNTRGLTVVERFDNSLGNTKNARITYRRLIEK